MKKTQSKKAEGHDSIDASYKRLLKAVHAVKEPRKTRAKKIKTQAVNQVTADSVVERIVNELIGRGVCPIFEALIEEPVQKLVWTKSLEGYKDARLSAADALLRLFVATDAARAGFECEHPTIDVFLFKIGAGLIKSDSPEINDMLEHAQSVGKADYFIKQLAIKFDNAKKRVVRKYGEFEISGTCVSDLNYFRTMLTSGWIKWGFWLMSDETIASVVNTAKLKPAGCNRQTITKAVKELGLLKHQETIVKGIGENSVFIFEDGYPPK
jgi:hypothetical protein